jgi:hypothetical protein
VKEVLFANTKGVAIFVKTANDLEWVEMAFVMNTIRKKLNVFLAMGQVYVNTKRNEMYVESVVERADAQSIIH